MKNKEITSDTISQIKKNNILFAQLCEIEKIVEKLYFDNERSFELNIDQFKKEISDFGEDFGLDYNIDSFLYAILSFCTINENLLMEDSKKLIQS
jgi:hypothetical protein